MIIIERSPIGHKYLCIIHNKIMNIHARIFGKIEQSLINSLFFYKKKYNLSNIKITN